jgi:hypothetical protein
LVSSLKYEETENKPWNLVKKKKKENKFANFGLKDA